LIELLASGGYYDLHAAALVHEEMLKRLAEQASAHRLKTGQDVYRAPERLADRLSNIG
jgi:hypothetical protein